MGDFPYFVDWLNSGVDAVILAVTRYIEVYI
jgi:hypothetical protein